MRTKRIVYGFMLAFVAFTVFLAFTPSPSSCSPWFTNIFASSTSRSSSSSSTSSASIFSVESYRSHFSSIFSYFFPNSSQQVHNVNSMPSTANSTRSQNATFQSPNLYKDPPTVTSPTQDKDDKVEVSRTNLSVTTVPKPQNSPTLNKQPSNVKNQTQNQELRGKIEALKPNQTALQAPKPPNTTSLTLNKQPSIVKNQTQNQELHGKVESLKSNQTANQAPKPPNTTFQSPNVNKQPSSVKTQTQNKEPQGKVALLSPSQGTIEAPKSLVAANQSKTSAVKSSPERKNVTGVTEKSLAKKGASSNITSSLLRKQGDGSNSGVSAKQGIQNLVESLMKCNLYDGVWVKDDSYPLYRPGSCSLIDEQFNCFQNGRPDGGYQKLKWKPKGCTLPRLNGGHMLQLLKGKRLVFVGDSLNRNMWESLVCILRSSAKDKKKVYEVFGRHHFRTEASHSFIFDDYNCTVEFFVSPFLVQEWEVPDKNGTKKETLRLDIIGRSSDKYKNADIVIFNTGHWWTHEKTSKGKDYYQEGSHVYSELNVVEAFRRALTTWARWVDANINPMRTLVSFRGYSASHFSGGQWNSGGQCDHETEPIKNEAYISQYPPKMEVLESVLKGMKTHVSYLNITRMTDYRKDGHPSIYRKQKLTEEERRTPLRFQDCSHWCLPGVPDAWNELLYAEILIDSHRRQRQEKRS